MTLSAGLTSDLRLLTVALEHPGVDLEALFEGLLQTTRTTVESFHGATITLIIEGSPLTFTAITETPGAADIVSSVRMPLDVLCDAVEPGSSLVLYATRPGAWTDYAAAVCFTLGLELDAIILDQHLTPPEPESGLYELAQVNQAIGILIHHGHTPTDAKAELHRRANYFHSTVTETAIHLINAAAAPTRPT